MKTKQAYNTKENYKLTLLNIDSNILNKNASKFNPAINFDNSMVITIEKGGWEEAEEGKRGDKW